MHTTISLRLTEEDAELFRSFAKMHGITISDLVRRTVMERIEDEFDLKSYEEAVARYRENPVTYSHEEVAKMLELD